MADRFLLLDLAEQLGLPDATATLPVGPRPVRLEGQEADHLLKVLRGKVGDQVELIDLRGLVAAGTLAATTRKAADITVTAVTRHHPKPADLLIAAALPKGDRLGWMVEKLTELDADHWVPLATRRGVVKPDDARLDKLDRTVVEACKQCRRAMPLRRMPVLSLSAYLAGQPGLFFDVSGPRFDPTVATGLMAEGRSLRAAVGPEGGWTDEERTEARLAGWHPCRLPGNVLRCETAAVAAAALLRPLLPDAPEPTVLLHPEADG